MSRLFVPEGTRFARLTIVREVAADKWRSRRFQCVCDCGNRTVVYLGALRAKRISSCGCLQREMVGKRAREIFTTHGQRSNPLYSVWRQMHARCYNPKNKFYHQYGGRGIKVCKEWHGDDGLLRFIHWAENNGYEPGLEIDKKDNDKGYSPKNCRWVTEKVQARNRRNNVWVKYKGKEILFIKLWEDKGKLVSYSVALTRYRQCGWNPIRAVSAPARYRGKVNARHSGQKVIK